MTTEEKVPQTKSKIPYFFVVFFSVILAVNLYYIYLSKKTWSGLVTEDSYQKGLHYNQVFSDARKQKELGWNMTVSYQNLGGAEGDLVVFLRDKDRVQIPDAEVMAYIRRPAQVGQDFSQKLEFVDGKYQTQIHFPLRGQWDILINTTKGKDSFQEAKRYIIQ